MVVLALCMLAFWGSVPPSPACARIVALPRSWCEREGGSVVSFE
jgi:hypothetical protein